MLVSPWKLWCFLKGEVEEEEHLEEGASPGVVSAPAGWTQGQGRPGDKGQSLSLCRVCASEHSSAALLGGFEAGRQQRPGDREQAGKIHTRAEAGETTNAPSL